MSEKLVADAYTALMFDECVKKFISFTSTAQMYDAQGVLQPADDQLYLLEANISDVSAGDVLTFCVIGGNNENHWFNFYDANHGLISTSLFKCRNYVRGVFVPSGARYCKISMWSDTVSYACAVFPNIDFKPHLFVSRGEISQLANISVGMYNKSASNSTVESDACFPSGLQGYDCIINMYGNNEGGSATTAAVMELVGGQDDILAYRFHGGKNFRVIDRNLLDSIPGAVHHLFSKIGTILKLEDYSGPLYNDAGNLIYTQNQDIKLYTKKVNITGGETIVYEEYVSARYLTHYYNEYSSDGTLLRNQLMTGKSWSITTLPNTSYILLSIWQDSRGNIVYTPASGGGDSPGSLKVVAFGDSIAQGYASGPSGLHLTDFGGFLGLASNYSDSIVLVNYANATGGFVKKGNNGKNGCEIISSASFSDADIVAIFYGINDYGISIDSGLGDTNSVTGDGTVSGSIRFMIETAISKAPSASVVMYTPLNMSKESSESTHYSYNKSGVNGFTLKAVCDLIQYWCDYYDIICIDWTRKNPIVNFKNITTLLYDGLHPTDVAHHKLAYAFLQSLTMWIAD